MSVGQVLHVSRRLGGRLVLTDVTLAVAPGEILGLVGPNGAGKTTLLRIFAGILRPSAGTLAQVSTEKVAYFGGEQTLPPHVSAQRWVRLWSSGLAKDTTRRRFAVLSRGTRQRIGLEAILISREPTLLLLDEPWEGLDPDASRWLSDALIEHRQRGAGVVVSSHRIHDLADVCDRCVFLVNGRLFPEHVAVAGGATRAERSAQLFAAFDRAKLQR